MLRVITIFLFCLFQTARAHTVDTVFLSFQETGDSWQVEILLDASLAVPELRYDDGGPQPKREWLYERTEDEYRMMRVEAEHFLRGAVSFSHGGIPVSYELIFTDFLYNSRDFPRLLNGGAYLTVLILGELGGEAGEFVIHAAEENQPDIVVAVGDGDEKSYLILKPGESEPLFLTATSGVHEVRRKGAAGLLVLGFLHVIPDGLDHILFILCLFLIARQWRGLLAQSLVFTIAHSLTLGLAVSGVLAMQSFPAVLLGLIEPLIAVSILVLAVENVLRKKVARSRYLIVFVFGLIHGLGFAGSLGASLQQGGEWLLPLALTNLGVELAQVSVLFIAWILTMPIARFPSYEVFQKTCSIAIGLIATGMVIERVLF